MNWTGCGTADVEETDPYHAMAEMDPYAAMDAIDPYQGTGIDLYDVPGFTLSASEVDAALGRGVMRMAAPQKEAKPWNTCPHCKQCVDVPDESFDGSDVRCLGCRAWLVCVERYDGSWTLEPVLPASDDDEPSVGDVEGYPGTAALGDEKIDRAIGKTEATPPLLVVSDNIRPRGTVEVTCRVDDCGWSWWVDALDPLLPDGPFLCSEHGGPRPQPGPVPKAPDADLDLVRRRILSLPAPELADLWERLVRFAAEEGGEKDG